MCDSHSDQGLNIKKKECKPGRGIKPPSVLFFATVIDGVMLAIMAEKRFLLNILFCYGIILFVVFKSILSFYENQQKVSI